MGSSPSKETPPPPPSGTGEPAKKGAGGDAKEPKGDKQPDVIKVKPAPDQVDEEPEEQPSRDYDYPAKPRPPPDDSDLPRPKYSIFRSHTKKSASNEERMKLLRKLDDEAKIIIENPPGPVLNSHSYASSYEHYKTRCSARNEEELKQWFRLEKKSLQQDTVELMLKAKLDASKDVETTRLNITSEFKLRLSALVNQYLETKATYDEETMQKEQDKNEDELFFGTMLDRVKNKTIARDDVLNSIDGYSAECRKKMASTRGSAASWKSGNSSIYPTARQPNVYPRQYPTPIPSNQLEVGGGY